MKRRIIRSFFIGLLLLCVGGWAVSYKYSWSINNDKNAYEWNVACGWGRIDLTWLPSKLSQLGIWQISAGAAEPSHDEWLTDSFKVHSHHWLGFVIANDDEITFVAIPFWYPTTVSAGLLWLVWRKTRPKPVGRAFPVELAKPIGEQGGVAGSPFPIMFTWQYNAVTPSATLLAGRRSWELAMATGVHCKKCGYDLQGPAGGLCPRCSYSVADSLTFIRRGRRNFRLLIRGSALVAAAMGVALLSATKWVESPIIDLIIAIFWNGLLLMGVILLVKSHTRSIRERWPWSGMVGIGGAALLMVLDVIAKSFWWWGRTAEGPSIDALGWLLNLQAWIAADILFVLFAGALFARRFSRQFHMRGLSHATFYLFLVAAIVPMVDLLAECGRVASLRRIPVVEDFYVFRLYFPHGAWTALKLGTPPAMMIYWIVIAVAAWRLKRNDERGFGQN